MTATIDIAPGARAVEGELLDAVLAHVDAAREDPALLAAPIRIVVPSNSLRLHVAARLVHRFGSVAGVQVQTLFAVALEILSNAGRDARGGDVFVELLARRAASREPALRKALEGFEDGYRTAVATVRDLLDACLEPEHAEALQEALEATGAGGRRLARGAAVVRAAAAVAGKVRALGRGGRAELLTAATEAFEASPETALPARALLVHGFADATGRATELLSSLVRRLPGRVLLDHPPDPAHPDRPDASARFTDRLRERLESNCGTARRVADAPAPGRPSFFRAPGAGAEAREVARRILARLEERDGRGTAPESIGIVARNLGPYRAALRTHLGRLGIPFSSDRERAPLDGAGRRLLALGELLSRGLDTTPDRWLDAVAELPHLPEERGGAAAAPPHGLRPPYHDLRLALRVAGAVRLADVAALEPDALLDERDRLALPVRYGALGKREPVDSATPGTEAAPRASRTMGRRRLDGFVLRAVVEAARRTVERLEGCPERGPVSDHARAVLDLTRRALGWRRRRASGPYIRLKAVLSRLEDGLLGTGEDDLERREFLSALGPPLEKAAAPPLGGAGGGVQVMEAMDARGRTFEALFLLGANRDVFPRVIGEDPLLDDDLRRAAAELLPDVPIKARGRDEERYLFAQLLSASSDVTVSWQFADDTGKAHVVSPLVELLADENGELDAPAAPRVFPEGADAACSGPRTAREHAVVQGLARGPEGLEARLGLALAEASAAPPPPALAAARARVVAAFEDAGRRPLALGPWLGFLGELPPAAESGRPDPAVEPLFVTRIEALARCPWKAVLERFLGLEPMPDPLERLPDLEPRVIGGVAHAVLERIARESLVHDEVTLDGALAHPAAAPDWPDAERLEVLVHEVAMEHLSRRKTPLPGLVHSVAQRARRYVEEALAVLREEERRCEAYGVHGVELTGTARVEATDGHPYEVAFKVDWVDRQDERLVLTDFKTGRAVTQNKLGDGVRDGQGLQAVVYAVGARERADEVFGRYLYLKPDVEQPSVGVGEHLERHTDDLALTLGTVFGAWRKGTLFPRLALPGKDARPEACGTCEVAEACLQGDSGARRALTTLVDEREGPPELVALFEIGQERREEEAG